MVKEKISVDGITKYGPYSPGIRSYGIVWLSGQIDPQAGDVIAQAKGSMAKIDQLLDAAKLERNIFVSFKFFLLISTISKESTRCIQNGLAMLKSNLQELHSKQVRSQQVLQLKSLLRQLTRLAVVEIRLAWNVIQRVNASRAVAEMQLFENKDTVPST